MSLSIRILNFAEIENLMRQFFSLFLSLLFFLNYGQSTSVTIHFLDEASLGNQDIISESKKITGASDEFDFIGISAYTEIENLEATIHYRIKRLSGIWSEWTLLRKNDHGRTIGRTSFEGDFIKEKFKEIQFKSDKVYFNEFTFRFYFPPSSSQQAVLKTGAQCSCPQPAYCDRNCWCPNNDCPKDLTPSSTQPTHIIIHHSAGANTSNDFAAIVAYYWDLHVNTNGWDDIGYNWLIDPNGVIYEGRGDGVGGAHFSCMNGGTTGICLIGNFQTVAPKQAAIAQLKNLISWEACDKNISPNQSSYHPSSMLNLENISSHRDGNNATVGCPKGTSCPGNLLYARLDSIRLGVDSLACIQGVSLNPKIVMGPEINIFPNPSSDKVSIEFQLAKSGAFLLEIYNPLGQVIRSWTIEDGLQENRIDLNIKDWDKGLYQVNLITDTREISKSLLIR